MFKTVSFLCCFFIFSLIFSHAQNLKGRAANNGSLFIENTLQSKQKVNNATGFCQIPNLSLGLNLPIYNYYKPASDTLNSKYFGINLSASNKWSSLKLSFLPEDRLLINAKLGFNSYYFLKRKNALNLNISGLLNEDAFTINKPSLKYNYAFLYSRFVSNKFSYHTGIVYSYIYGEGILLPALGFKYKIGQKSQLSIILPLQFTYKTPISSKLMLLFYLHPQGGINRFQNDTNLTGNASEIVLFRRKSVALGCIFIIKLKDNLSLLADPSFLLDQHFYFSEDNERKGTQYTNNTLEKGFQIRTRLIWRPWNKKSKKDQPDDLLNDDIYLLGL
ncbi:MAG: DUF6268 family outer membrane beta-barrel protein [Bacteroidota bacterium]|nr:DUF6268 family outer membrane beta-barrel protein [Bacteroidota bacterium]